MPRRQILCVRLTLPGNEKTALAIAIANREKDILKDMDYEKGVQSVCGNSFFVPVFVFTVLSVLRLWKNGGTG